MKIGINCGHTASGVGCGAIGHLNESNETRAVGKALMSQLKKLGHTVYNCTNDKASSTNENLSAICNLANKQKLDLFVSIHFNAGGGKGVECFTWKGSQVKEAVNICKEIKNLGFNNRGVKDGSGLYVIKNTNATAILIEVCFVDTKTDADLYKKVGAEAVASAICKAITGKDVVTVGEKFTDTVGHYAKNTIDEIAEMGIMTGTGNNKFEHDKQLTRAEAAIIARNIVRYITGK